jgi:glycosyltransferase involved in cell wall biosynthesis
MLDPYFNRIKPLKALIKQIFWWAADGPLTNHATATLFVSKEEMRLAPQSFWPYRANAQLMPFGIQDVPLPSKIFEKKFRALCPELADRNYLLFLSRLHPKKGCDLLLHAFVALNPPDVDLVLAGPDEGQKRLLEALAKTLGVSGRVHFPGMLQGDAKWGAYYGADVFILPSHQENFGLVVAEALACSLPVLTTNKVATAPIVASNFAGFVGTDDLAGIKAIIQTYMLLSSQDKERLSQNARQAFTKYFDVATLAPQMLEVFNQTNK